jgi:dTDP-4-amino-4,6-dideoxygalactose transaminase
MAAYSIANAKKLLLPNFTFESTRCAATLQGIEVELADVELDSGCLPISAIHASQADTVVAVCALSTVPDLDNIQQACRETGKKLVIDGAASFGTPNIWNYGDFFALSMHGTKTYPISEAGAIICSKEDARLIRQYIMFGFDENRNPVRRGMNAKLSEYACAIGLAVWDKVRQELLVKREFAAQIKAALPANAILKSTAGLDTIYQSIPIIMDSVAKSDAAIAEFASLGIETKKYYKPLSSMPTTDKLYSHSVCIPCHSLAATETDLILDVLSKHF